MNVTEEYAFSHKRRCQVPGFDRYFVAVAAAIGAATRSCRDWLEE
jgi:hypothetical protein